ncbi:hypothetical protein ACFX2G_015263 [Malus domestica]
MAFALSVSVAAVLERLLLVLVVVALSVAAALGRMELGLVVVTLSFAAALGQLELVLEMSVLELMEEIAAGHRQNKSQVVKLTLDVLHDRHQIWD